MQGLYDLGSIIIPVFAERIEEKWEVGVLDGDRCTKVVFAFTSCLTIVLWGLRCTCVKGGSRRSSSENT